MEAARPTTAIICLDFCLWTGIPSQLPSVQTRLTMTRFTLRTRKALAHGTESHHLVSMLFVAVSASWDQGTWTTLRRMLYRKSMIHLSAQWCHLTVPPIWALWASITYFLSLRKTERTTKSLAIWAA